MFIEQSFSIPQLQGMSHKSIEEHLKLYAGYVKNANSIVEKLATLDIEKDGYTAGELFRRFSFEYNGMRNHEIYFALLEGDSSGSVREKAPTFGNAIADQWGSFEKWVNQFQTLALTRGVGWAMLWYDNKNKTFLTSWVDEQHLGQLQGCSPIIALDMWEHSYVADYQPSGKKQYIQDFWWNMNWSVVEKLFIEAQK
jgi:superoxide dismutase, Fe-Mn family